MSRPSFHSLYNHRKDEFPLLSFDTIKIVYEDTEITILLLNPKVIESLPDVLKNVHRLVSTSNEPIHEIYIPTGFAFGEFSLWNGNFLSIEPKEPTRYWLLKVKDASGSERIYDSITGKTIDTWPFREQLSQYTGAEIATDELLEALLASQEHTKNVAQS